MAWFILLSVVLIFMHSLLKITSSERAKPETKKRLFYMYDLPEVFWWRWPIEGSDCGNSNGYISHHHKENSGVGKLLSAADGLYFTWHGGMFSSLYTRFKRSKLRTFDPEKASIFIIPYDLGLDGYLDPGSCTGRLNCTSGLVPTLLNTLNEQKYFKRNDGADHVVLWSLGQLHHWPTEKCNRFMKDYCRKCTITCYWMDSSKYEQRFVSLPFSSSFHWWEGIKTLPWDLTYAASRNLTMVYLGSTKTLNPISTKLRIAITKQCQADPECHWFQVGHSSRDIGIAGLLSVYKQSVFCLCPPGDDPTRKAVVDIIVSGCIPVFFNYMTLHNQHPWHLTEQDTLDISVYIPEWKVRTNVVNVMEVLRSISPEVIRKKQEALAFIAPRIQYAMPPPQRLKSRYDNTTWDPPFQDSVLLTLEGMFNRADDVLHNRSTHIPLKQQYNWIWNDEYKDTRIQEPNITQSQVAARRIQDTLMKKSMLRYQKKVLVGSRKGKRDRAINVTASASVKHYQSSVPKRGVGRKRIDLFRELE